MMKNKKLLVAMLSIACACACTFAFSSCDAFPSGKSEQNYERQEGTLSLENSIFNVRVGVKGFVVPTGYIAVEGKYLSFESSDKTVVSVNQYGEFTAIKEGSANIIVKYGEATATAIVNVSWDGENPRLRMNKEIEDSGVLKLSGLEAFDLGLWVYYNANAWKDATYEYIVSDPTVGCVEDGEFIPLKNGTTSVTVKATWREKTCPTMEKTFTVMVGDEVELSVNDGLGGMIKLYTKENVGDRSFSVSSPFVITANKMVDGEKFPLQTSVNI